MQLVCRCCFFFMLVAFVHVSSLLSLFVSTELRRFYLHGFRFRDYDGLNSPIQCTRQNGKLTSTARAIARLLEDLYSSCSGWLCCDPTRHSSVDHHACTRAVGYFYDTEGGFFDENSVKAIERSIERAIERSSKRPSDREIKRSSDRARDLAIDRAIERSSGRAVERSSGRAIERSSDRAIERTSDRVIESSND